MNHLALTIGPIVETLLASKKTKELFTGSYLFSYFMKELLVRLRASGYELLVPYHQDIETLFKQSNGIGIFHDRLMVSHTKEQEFMAEDIENYMSTILAHITQKTIDIDSRNNAQYQDLIQSFWEQYFQFSYVIRDEFAFKALNNTLNVAELHREFIVSTDDYNVLRDQEGKRVNPLVYLQRKFHQSFLKEEAFANRKSDFPSVLEIALEKEINYTYEKDKDELLEEEAMESEKNHKKYMALIQADGDKIGAILDTMDKEPEKIRLFSEKLLEFTQKIPNIASRYNAQVVYAGGDDMLAFAPIITQNEKTVFDFLKEIDDEFKATLKTLNIEEANAVSQSFGVSLIYHKKPLYQALSKATNNLLNIAKADDRVRNRAVVELIKHSGQTFVIDMVLNSTIYKNFNELLKQELNEDKSALPHAVTHNIARSKATLKAIADEYEDDKLVEMIDNFFDNNFNKEVHSEVNTESALKLTKALLLEHLKMYQEEKSSKNFEKCFRAFTSLLSMIKHLRGDR